MHGNFRLLHLNLLQNNAQRITDFLDRLSTPISNSEPQPAQYSDETLAKNMSVIVNHLTTNFAKVRPSMLIHLLICEKVETFVAKDPRLAADPTKTKEAQGQLATLKTILKI